MGSTFGTHFMLYRYKGKFEMTYVSPSQVIVKRLATGMGSYHLQGTS